MLINLPYHIVAYNQILSVLNEHYLCFYCTTIMNENVLTCQISSAFRVIYEDVRSNYR